MRSYKMVTTITDHGPYVSKLILELPFSIRREEVTKESFHVYVERLDEVTQELIYTQEWGSDIREASKGYQRPLNIYPCDEEGFFKEQGCFAAIELPEEKLGKRIEGTVLSSCYIRNKYRITQLHGFGDDPEKTGLVFTECAGELCPQLKGWHEKRYDGADKKLSYGFFQPQTDQKKLPLVVWLHGAGEGGDNPRIAYTGNKVVNISSPEIQKKLGGGAWILVPQCPTVWMDDGNEQMGRTSQSIYTKLLKECIDEFIAANSGQIDTDRILIGGLSNGGFMTIRMLIDYPGFFAGALPVCEAFFDENITDEMVGRLKDVPIWFVHTDTDELVSPRETSLPLYHRLKAAGAGDVHFTYFEHMEDLSGCYKDAAGRPMRYFNHAAWIHVYNDDCHTELDGRNVCVQGKPVTIWEWMGGL